LQVTPITPATPAVGQRLQLTETFSCALECHSPARTGTFTVPFAYPLHFPLFHTSSDPITVSVRARSQVTQVTLTGLAVGPRPHLTKTFSCALDYQANSHLPHNYAFTLCIQEPLVMSPPLCTCLPLMAVVLIAFAHADLCVCWWCGSFLPRLPLVPSPSQRNFLVRHYHSTLALTLAHEHVSRHVTTTLCIFAMRGDRAHIVRTCAFAHGHGADFASHAYCGPHLHLDKIFWCAPEQHTNARTCTIACLPPRVSTTLHTCAAHVGRDHSVRTHVCAFAGGADLAGHACIGPHLRRNEIFSCALE
jgi:hypothetical protein